MKLQIVFVTNTKCLDEIKRNKVGVKRTLCSKKLHSFDIKAKETSDFRLNSFFPIYERSYCERASSHTLAHYFKGMHRKSITVEVMELKIDTLQSFRMFNRNW